MTSTIEQAHGRWREILPALGTPPQFLNGKHQPCPICGGVDRARFTDRRGDGDYFCSGCGPGKGIQFLMKLNGWDFARTAREVDSIIGNLPDTPPTPRAKRIVSPAELNAMWQASTPVTPDDPVGRYLASRGIRLDFAGMSLRPLRYVAHMHHHPTGSDHPGMLATVCAADGKPSQLHRTYLTQDGCKADVDPVRMFMAGELPKGGAIRLGPVEAAMGIAEGIETALSAAILFKMPVWATMGTAMLEMWQPPAEAREITIFGDADRSFAGQCSAYALARRLIFEATRDKVDREVRVLLPDYGDWNDHLRRRAPPPTSKSMEAR